MDYLAIILWLSCVQQTEDASIDPGVRKQTKTVRSVRCCSLHLQSRHGLWRNVRLVLPHEFLDLLIVPSSPLQVEAESGLPERRLEHIWRSLDHQLRGERGWVGFGFLVRRCFGLLTQSNEDGGYVVGGAAVDGLAKSGGEHGC